MNKHLMYELSDDDSHPIYEAKAYVGTFYYNCFSFDVLNPLAQPIFLIAYTQQQLGYVYHMITDGEKFTHVNQGVGFQLHTSYGSKSLISKKRVREAIRELVK